MHKQTTPCHKSAAFLPFTRSCKFLTAFTTIVAMGLAIGTPAAHAGNSWIGAGTSTNWSDKNNWSSGALPGYGTLTFSIPSKTSNIDDNITAMNGLLWTGSSAWTLSGTTVLSLYDNNNVQAKIENQSTKGVTINLPITFAATKGASWGEINAVNGDLTFSGGALTVNGSAVNGIYMYGSGHNTTFNNTVDASGKYFATTGSNDTINIGGTFTSGDFYLMNGGALNLNGGGFNTSALRLGGDFGNTGSQNLTQGATFNLADTGGGQTFSNTINTIANNTSGGLIINSQNTSGTNTLSGQIALDSNLSITQADGGLLNITQQRSSSSDTFTGLDIKGNTLSFSGAGNIAVSGTIYNSTSNGTVSYNGTGAGILTISGANSYSGQTNINAGTIAVAAGGSLGSSTVYVGNGGSGSANTSAALNLKDSGLTSSNTIVVNKADNGSGIGSGTRTIGGSFTSGSSSFTGNVYLNGNVVLTASAGGTVKFSGSIQNGTDTGNTSHAVTKTGAGTVILLGSNTYTGSTTVNQGTLSGNAGSYSSGSISVASGATVDYTQSGTGTATNNISGTGNATFGGNTVSANGSGGTVNYTGTDSVSTAVQSGTVALANPSGAALTGPVAVATGAKLETDNNNQLATATNGNTSPTNVTLSGGTINANGKSDGSFSGSISNPTATAVTSHLGSLTLATGTTSTFDFGLNSSNVWAFADSSASLGSGKLNVLDYVGGQNALYIGTTKSLSQSQLNQIAYNGVFGAFSQLGNGEIILSPTPEPSGMVTGLVGVGVLGGVIVFRWRRAGRAMTANG